MKDEECKGILETRIQRLRDKKKHNILGECKVVIGGWIAAFQLLTYLLLVSVLLPNLMTLTSQLYHILY